MSSIAANINPGLSAGDAHPAAADSIQKGSLSVFDGLKWTVLPAGTDGQTLQADSSTSTGLKWNTV